MNKGLISDSILIILAHLDDEFAIAPYIVHMSRKNKTFKVLYCAERLSSKKQLTKSRRSESIKSLKIMGIEAKNIFFLNDYYAIDDKSLILASEKIYHSIYEFDLKYKFNKIITLAIEGGHPDHDALALIVNKYSKKNKKTPYFFPAYNYEKTFFLPYSVYKPLRAQIKYSNNLNTSFNSWVKTLKISLIYRSEIIAFLKIIPFIIYKLIFSRKIFFMNKIDYNAVNWEQSLTKNRYKKEFKDILQLISNL